VIGRSREEVSLKTQNLPISNGFFFSDKILFYFYLGHLRSSYSSDRYLFGGKRPIAIAAMYAELPSSKNGEHNFESASTIDCVITLLICLPMSPVTQLCLNL